MMKTKFHDWDGVSPVTTFFMIHMAFFLDFVFVLDSVALLQGDFNKISKKYILYVKIKCQGV